MRLIPWPAPTVALALFLMSGQAAAVDDYRCVIEKVALARSDSGAKLDLFHDTYVGKEFTVERTSGLMAGALKNSYATKPQVIDLGSKENSFKVVTTMRVEEGAGAGSNVYALTVLEYEEGSHKPFVFLMNEAVFFGHCVHF